MRRINRITPKMPVQAYRTFSLKQPPGVVVDRPASCKEVNCEAYLNGWVTTLPADGPRTVELIAEIRRFYDKTQYTESGLTFVDNMRVVQFAFQPGSQCFRRSTHRIQAKDWEPLYIVRDGDWRADLGFVRRHVNGEHFAEDLQQETERGFRRMERG